MKTHIYVRAGQSRDSRLLIDDQCKVIRGYLDKLSIGQGKAHHYGREKP
ncbi:MAG: hypothetical protein IID46_16335 [Planctomycetes bacterium]|nr:hypothetical protein [Planctomycetota bacterium]